MEDKSKAPFLYCKDQEYQYIVDVRSGKVIYKKTYTAKGQSYFCFCGNTKAGPVFYDAHYCTYLYPESGKYKAYPYLFNHPVIVNGQNFVNVTEGDSGVGVVDSFGNVILDNVYKEVNIELRVIGTNRTQKDEKIIPLPNSPFKKGIVTDIDEWI